MSEAPERIWAYAGAFRMWREKYPEHAKSPVEYIRADRIEALERQVKAADALAEKLQGWIGVAATCAIESGVCRCGDNMERHGNPLDCGHSPVDHGAYVATQLIDDTTSALAAYTATKEGGA